MTNLKTVLAMSARLATVLLLTVAVFATTIDTSDAQSRRNKNETKSSGSKTISVKIQKQVIEDVRRLLEDESYRRVTVEHNYAVANRFYSYSALRRSLRTLITNIKGLEP